MKKFTGRAAIRAGITMAILGVCLAAWPIGFDGPTWVLGGAAGVMVGGLLGIWSGRDELRQRSQYGE